MMAVLRGPVEPPDDLVIVAIDDLSMEDFRTRYGYPYPWPRGFHGELIQQLSADGARLIVFDVVFEGESANPEEDRFLAEAIEQSQAPVILASALEVIDDPRFSMVRELEPLGSLLEAGAHEAFATLNPDSDGTLRNGRLFVGGEPTLATDALALVGQPVVPEQLPVSDYEGSDPEVLVNYVGGSRRIPTVSYYQALDRQEYLPDGFFADKVVFVGYSLAVTDLTEGRAQDHYPSPFDGLTGQASMPGVEIHANIFDTLSRERFIRPVSLRTTWALIVVLALMITLLVLLIRRFFWKILLSLTLMLGFIAVSWILFTSFSIWIYTVQPVAILFTIFGLNTLYQYRSVEKERAHIRQALSGYVSRQVMGEILKRPGRLELGGTQVEATVLFSDIAGFSKISEGTSPRELASLLNDYFTRMGDAIMARDGMINKYIGDAVMAIWNAPLPNSDHARLACEAALEMEEVCKSLHPIKMRLGINTGQMVAGNLGHRERMEYTVIGDAVNLASRLEGANKVFGTRILISETTHLYVQDSFLTRRVDRIRVVGKMLPVAVFEVLGDLRKEISQDLIDMVLSFEEILERYDSRNWEGAADLLSTHLSHFPRDSVASAYLSRCIEFKRNPPPKDWDGVYELESK